MFLIFLKKIFLITTGSGHIKLQMDLEFFIYLLKPFLINQLNIEKLT